MSALITGSIRLQVRFDLVFVIILEISASVSDKPLRAIIIHIDVDINAVTKFSSLHFLNICCRHCHQSFEFKF